MAGMVQADSNSEDAPMSDDEVHEVIEGLSTRLVEARALADIVTKKLRASVNRDGQCVLAAYDLDMVVMLLDTVG